KKLLQRGAAFRKPDQTLAEIARRDDAEFFAQLATGPTAVRRRDHDAAFRRKLAQARKKGARRGASADEDDSFHRFISWHRELLAADHFQSRTSGMSSPCLDTYRRCSASFFCISSIRSFSLLPFLGSDSMTYCTI